MIHFPGNEDIEDLVDVEDALAEPSDPIPAEELWAKLGLTDEDGAE